MAAFAAGGALETVVDGETGVLFHAQTADALAAALVSLSGQEFAPDALRQHASRFSLTVFKDRMTRFIEGALDQHQSRLRSNYGIGPYSSAGIPNARPEDEGLFNPFLRVSK